MTVGTNAGTTLGVSATLPGSHDFAGFDALSFTTVGEITDLGEFGREYALITHNPVDTRATQKFKGSYNEGAMNLSLGLDTDDAGQIIMKAASASDNDYAFKVTIGSSLDEYFFLGKVMSWKVGPGGVDNLVGATCSIELTSSSAGLGIVENLSTA